MQLGVMSQGGPGGLRQRSSRVLSVQPAQSFGKKQLLKPTAGEARISLNCGMVGCVLQYLLLRNDTMNFPRMLIFFFFHKPCCNYR